MYIYLQKRGSISSFFLKFTLTRLSVFFPFWCHLICGFNALLQGTWIVFAETKANITILPFPWPVLMKRVGKEALNLAVLMPWSSTKLQRNHSCSQMWEKKKKSMKQTCIDWFRQRFSHSISKKKSPKTGCSSKQHYCCLERKCSLPQIPSCFKAHTVITHLNAKLFTK